MEGIRRAGAMCRGIGEWIDDLELLDNRAGPSVADEERQRLLMLGTDVNEMDIEPVDLGDEVGQILQSLLALAPVVVCRPVVRECLHGGELYALRQIIDGFLVGPACGSDASTQVLEVGLGGLDCERSQHCVGSLVRSHVGPPWIVDGCPVTPPSLTVSSAHRAGGRPG